MKPLWDAVVKIDVSETEHHIVSLKSHPHCVRPHSELAISKYIGVEDLINVNLVLRTMIKVERQFRKERRKREASFCSINPVHPFHTITSVIESVTLSFTQ